MRVYVFGDQTFDISKLLSNLLHAYEDPLLFSFFERSTLALKRQIAELPHYRRDLCPRFSRLANLLPLWRKGLLNPALGQSLTCICQLGYFIRYDDSVHTFLHIPIDKSD